MAILTDTVTARLRRMGEEIVKTSKRPVLRLTLSELSRLGEYSASLPTGTTIGKRWKRNIHPECNGAAGYPPHQTTWVIGEYYDCGIPGQVGILWYDVEVVND